MPTIAAILFIVAYNMCQWRTFLQLVKIAPKSDIPVSYTHLVQESFGLSRILISLTVAVVFIIVVFGGIKSIASFANKLVPAMTIIFIVASIAVIFTQDVYKRQVPAV